MQAIEVSIFLVSAFIAAALLTGFLFQFDFEKMQKGITGVLLGEKPDTTLPKVNFSGFLSYVYDCWQTCISQDFSAPKDINCKAVFLDKLPNPTDLVLTTTILKNEVQKINYCQDCNVAVEPPAGKQVPGIMNITCDVDEVNKTARILVN